jgi:hypothetical protein
VVRLAARFLQDASGGRDDDGVGADDERGVGDRGGCVGQRESVDVKAFLRGCLEDVFERGEGGFGEVLGFGGGEDLEVCETDLGGC